MEMTSLSQGGVSGFVFIKISVFRRVNRPLATAASLNETLLVHYRQVRFSSLFRLFIRFRRVQSLRFSDGRKDFRPIPESMFRLIPE
jgi:hypothetical protein